MVACVALVLVFESTALAAAYGIAVTDTMGITSVPVLPAHPPVGLGPLDVVLVGLFLVFWLAFLGANLVKIAEGGWVPIAVAGAVFVVMTTWKAGRASLGRHILASTLPMELFLEDVATSKPHQVEGHLRCSEPRTPTAPRRAPAPFQAQQGPARAGEFCCPCRPAAPARCRAPSASP